MMRATQRRTRPAFTLMELVLALALVMLLFGALYFTLSTQLGVTQAGREAVADGEIARSVMNRIGNDILAQVGPVDPRVANYAAPTNPDGTTASDQPTPVSFNIGVSGDGTNLILSVYRVQKGPANAATNVPDPIVTSDLRRISYWLVTNGADTLGLARQEIQQATSPDIDTAPSGVADPTQYLLAKEVKNILFEYFDGTAWQPQWDGTLAPDGVTPSGPPTAIRVTVTMRRSAKTAPGASDIPDEQLPTYVHVIALPTANNFAAKTSGS